MNGGDCQKVFVPEQNESHQSIRKIRSFIGANCVNSHDHVTHEVSTRGEIDFRMARKLDGVFNSVP